MRVLVTGGGGFVGEHLRDRLLAAGHEVICTTQGEERSPPMPARGGETVVGGFDLATTPVDGWLSLLGLHGVEAIIHLAAVSSVTECARDFHRALIVNVGGTRNLFTAAHRYKRPIRFVFASTAEVYRGLAGPGEQLLVNEEMSTAVTHEYALTKILSECVLTSSKYDLVSVVVFRPCNHIGPGQSDRFAVGSFARQMAAISRRQAPPVLKVGDLSASRDFTDVRDVVQAYAAGLEAGRGVYVLGSGQAVSLSAIVAELRRLSGVAVEIEVEQSRLREAAEKEGVIVADASRAQRDLGWQARIPLTKTLQDAMNVW